MIDGCAKMGNEFQNRCLKHHGILGQKWGVRRFQNPDGSLTAAGIERYRKGTKNRMNETHGVVQEALAVASLAYTVAVLVTNTVKTHKWRKQISQMVEDAQEKDSNAKKYEHEREGETIDPESGLYSKNKKMTINEDMERINPNFRSGNDCFKVNCTACTVAMELRQRGFDVYAGTDGKTMAMTGGTSAKERKVWYKDEEEYMERTRKGVIKMGKNSAPEKKLQAVEAHLGKTPNTHGELLVDWRGGSGHSMYYKTDKKGKLTVFDTQANIAYTGDSLKKLLGHTERVSAIRLDDMEYHYDTLKKNNIII